MMRAAIWKQIAVVFLSAVVLSFLTASLFSDGDEDQEPDSIALRLPGGETGRVVDLTDETNPITADIRERPAELEQEQRQRRALEALAAAREAQPAVRAVPAVDPHPNMLGFVKRPYWLDEAAAADPFHVLEMWHDGRFTYLRTDAGSRPALYEQSEPGGDDLLPLGMYPATEGLYVVDGVAREGGWMRIGNDWAQWRLDGPEDGR